MVMAPPAGAGAGARPGPRRRPGEFGAGGRKFTPRRKVCAFCVDKIKVVDYKDLARLRRFLSERGKIEPRRKTGTCAAHQRSLNVALKRARQLAMLPFTAEHIRVTGVVVREPGAPPFRGARGPRPAEPVEAAAEVAEAAPADGVAAEAPAAPAAPAPVSAETGEAAGGTPTSPESPQAVAVSAAAQGTSDTPATGPTQPES
jgi:small subunit ribosomal protein S18